MTLKELNINATHGTIHPILLQDENNTVLVDAGYPGQFEVIKKALNEIGVKPSDIDTLILTHHDIDHVGCIKEIAQSSKNLRIMAHEIEIPYIQGDKTPIKLEYMEKNYDSLPEDRKGFYAIFKAFFSEKKLPVTDKLIDKQVLPLCGGIEIIHVPGHTHGHICLYIHALKAVICGDTMNIEDGKLIELNPAMNYDSNQAKESIKKLTNYDIETIYTYHKGKLENGNAAIAKFIKN